MIRLMGAEGLKGLGGISSWVEIELKDAGQSLGLLS